MKDVMWRVLVFAAAMLVTQACDNSRAVPVVPDAEDVIAKPKMSMPPAGWSVSIDNPASPTNLYYPGWFKDTLWTTVRNNMGVERFDAWNWVECNSDNGYVTCSDYITSSRSGGFKVGFVVNYWQPASTSNIRARLLLDNSSYTYSASIVYRALAVSSIAIPSSPDSVRLDSLYQYTSIANTPWHTNIIVWPRNFTSSDPTVGTITSSGLFLAKKCGTTQIVDTRQDGFGLVSASKTVKVYPCRLRIAASGPTVIGGGANFCTFTGTILEGTPPYSQNNWYGDGTGHINGSTIELDMSWINGANYINYWVRDATGQDAFVHIDVTFDPSAPMDPRCRL